MTGMARFVALHLEKAARLVALSLALCSAGCASVPARRPAAGDPFERFNRSVYLFNTKLDHAVLRPMARRTRTLPVSVSHGIRHFFDNLLYPITIVNDFLQGNVHDGANDVARLMLDTTVGIGGIFDPATPAGLVRHCQDFGITLGKWGVPRGPFLMLPFLGPSTLRDAAAAVPELYAYVLVPGPAIGLGIYGANSLEYRAQLVPAETLIENAYDPYAFQRNAYVQYRDFQVRGSTPQVAQSDDAQSDDPAPADPPADDPPARPQEEMTLGEGRGCGCLVAPAAPGPH